MSVNSLYGFNPYAMQTQNSGLNNDFMYNATNTQGLQEQLALQQALLQGAKLQETQGDTFQKEGSSGSGTGLELAALGGIGAGAGAYFFGDKIGATITKDGKTFNDSILKAYQTNPIEIAKEKAFTEFVTQKSAIIQQHGFTPENYEAIKKYVSTTDKTTLPKEIIDLVPDNVKNNPDNFKAKLFETQTAIDAIDENGIVKQALADAEAGNLACQQEKLANLAKRKSLVEGLAKDATPAQIEELINKNPQAFGIEKTAEAEIKAEAKAIAQRYGTKAGALAEVTPLVTGAEDSIKNLRTTLNGEVAAHWDDAAKAFRADAPDVLKNAAKNFKWKTAGKWGAIAAGVGLVLGSILGGDK